MQTTETRSCPTPDVIARFRDGNLIDADLEKVAQHISSCVECSAQLSDAENDDPLVQKLKRSLRQEPLPEENAADAISRRARNIWGSGKSSNCDFSLASNVLPIPRILGQYEILESLNGGGMGDIYKARHTLMKRDFALKTLTAERANDPVAVARFRREMAAGGIVPDHQHLVRSTYAGKDGGVDYLVMDFVPGVDLGRIVKRFGSLSVANACELIRQAALGLAHMHAYGVVHRDVKPSNLILSEQGVVKVVDLGLALLPPSDDSDDALTSQWTVMGTTDYMPPEQFFDPHFAKPSADLYSLGCTLFKLLAGRAPFEDPSFGDRPKKLQAHSMQRPPHVSEFRDDVPNQLVELIDKLLAKLPAERGNSAFDVAVQLEPFSRGHSLAELLDCEEPHVRPLGISSTSLFGTATTPSRRHNGRGRWVRRWPWAFAAVALVLLGILGIVRLAGLGRDRNSVPETDPFMADVEPGRWHYAFRREPRKLTWTNLGSSNFHWEHDLDQVSVTYYGATARLQVGTIPKDRDFEFEVSIQAVRSEELDVGVFFGYREFAKNGVKQFPIVQGIHLHRLFGQRVPMQALQLSRYRQVGSQGGPVGSIPCPQLENKEYILRVHYDRTIGLKEVVWDGKPCGNLTSGEANKQFEPEDYQGPFGIMMSHGAATFRSFRYRISDERY